MILFFVMRRKRGIAFWAMAGRPPGSLDDLSPEVRRPSL